MARREEILQGIVNIPAKLWEYVHVDEDEKRDIEELWNRMVIKFFHGKTMSLNAWIERINPKHLNKIFMILGVTGWILVKTVGKFGTVELNYEKLLKWISEEELNSVVREFKIRKAMMTSKLPRYWNRTRTVNRHGAKVTRNVGLKRLGFAKSGSCPFKYDIKYVKEYLEEMAKEVYADYQKPQEGYEGEKPTYSEIVESLLLYAGASKDERYVLGECTSDSRGRAIFDCVHRVFNPISHKVARAIVKCPVQKLTTAGLKNVYLFIAEIFGDKPRTLKEKIELGKLHAESREIPESADLHEQIWLKRIYENLEDTDHWTVPIEVDATASAVQIMGVLMNDHKLMDLTNLINPYVLEDYWTVDYLPRKYVKFAVTPRIYGSSASPADLWDRHHLDYTQEDEENIEKDFERGGRFFAPNLFKDTILKCVPAETRKVRIWNEEFIVNCSKFKDSEEKQHVKIYTTTNGYYKPYARADRVVDVKQFVRYHCTLLVHNLDSQVMNYIGANMEWILCNHDAAIVHPNDAHRVRILYTSKLYEIYRNRHSILRNFMDSIGNTKTIRDVNREEVPQFFGTAMK